MLKIVLGRHTIQVFVATVYVQHIKLYAIVCVRVDVTHHETSRNKTGLWCVPSTRTVTKLLFIL
jgi:hypothetical protein